MSTMPTSAKRARSGEAGAPTAAECAKMVNRLSKEAAHALLAQLMVSSTEARAAVEAKVAGRDAEPVDLRAYSCEASDIVGSLDGLRPSQQFTRCGEVRDRLIRLVDECKEKLSTTQAFAAMVAIMGVVESEAEGEVRKGVLSCGGIDDEIARELKSLAQDMSSGEKASISDVVEDLECLVEVLDEYACGGGLKEVVTQMQGN